MPFKTIHKIFFFVILITLVSILGFACRYTDLDSTHSPQGQKYSTPQKTGNIDSKSITESSGLAVSKCNDEILWTHNDSGHKANLFAISQNGDLLGVHEFAELSNRDWESISSFKDTDGTCFLYIADIGNNANASRDAVIYRVTEPGNFDSSETAKPIKNGVAQSQIFAYPDGHHDAETLMVHPVTGDIYIITKSISDPAMVYKIASPQFAGSRIIAQKIAELNLPSIPFGAVTGGDISPDGRRVVLVDYLGGYELELPEEENDFDKIWLQPVMKFDAGDRKQGESVAYSNDGSSIFTTSEGANSPIYKISIIDRYK